MKMRIIETERLFLREFLISDAEQLYLLNKDPEVIQFTGDSAFRNVAEAKSFLENYEQYRKFGFGRWAVIDKYSGDFLGWCGLRYDAAVDETDIGFRFFKRYWNKGYATESARAAINMGFDKFRLQTLVGRAMKENTASIKVLEKLGMSFEKEFDFYRGHAGLCYRIDKNLV